MPILIPKHWLWTRISWRRRLMLMRCWIRKFRIRVKTFLPSCRVCWWKERMTGRAQMIEQRTGLRSEVNYLISKQFPSASKGVNRTIKAQTPGNLLIPWDLLASRTQDNHDIHKIQSIQGVSQEYQEARVQRNQASPGRANQRLSRMKDQIPDRYTKEVQLKTWWRLRIEPRPRLRRARIRWAGTSQMLTTVWLYHHQRITRVVGIMIQPSSLQTKSSSTIFHSIKWTTTKNPWNSTRSWPQEVKTYKICKSYMSLTSSSSSRTSPRCNMIRKEREEAQHWEIGPSHQCLRTTETQLTTRVKRGKPPRRLRRITIALLRTYKDKCLKIRWFFSTTYRLRISSLKSNRKGLMVRTSSITITIALVTWIILLTRISLSMIEIRLFRPWTNSRARSQVIWTSLPWAAVEPAAPERKPLEGKCRTQATYLHLNPGPKVKTLWSLTIPLSFWTIYIATCKTCRRMADNSKWLNKIFHPISGTSQTWTLAKVVVLFPHQAPQETLSVVNRWRTAK